MKFSLEESHVTEFLEVPVCFTSRQRSSYPADKTLPGLNRQMSQGIFRKSELVGKKNLRDKRVFVLLVGFKGGEGQCRDAVAQQRSGDREWLGHVALRQQEEQDQWPFK